MATSDEVFAEIKTSLIARAEVQDTERVFSKLDLFINEALVEYKNESTSDFSVLHVIERRLVVYLAWISVCYTRASAFAPQASQKPGSNTGFGFGADRDTPYKKCIDLAEKLREQYTLLKEDFDSKYGDLDDEDGSGSSGDVEIGTLVRREENLSVTVPYRQANAIPILVFERLTAAAGEALLSWSRFDPAGFSDAFVFRSSTAGIHQKWNHDGNSGVPFIAAAAEKVYATTDNIGKQIKQTGLPAGTYYYLLVVKSTNNVYSYSPELTVTVS